MRAHDESARSAAENFEQQPQAAAENTAATGLIEARSFSFWYGPKQALHDISLTVPARAITEDGRGSNTDPARLVPEV